MCVCRVHSCVHAYVLVYMFVHACVRACVSGGGGGEREVIEKICGLRE